MQDHRLTEKGCDTSAAYQPKKGLSIGLDSPFSIYIGLYPSYTLAFLFKITIFRQLVCSIFNHAF